MANEEHLAILRQGVEAWNRWRQENPETVPDLAHAELWRKNIAGALFYGVNLFRADLSEANLQSANLPPWLRRA